MKIFVDIDDTICYYNRDREKMQYDRAIPKKENIEKVNRLFMEGHEITYWTSRGTETGIDWEDVTRNQLCKWGALHHHLQMGKPFYHMFIDDRSINSLWDWDEYSLKKIIDSHK